jgi:hypothetical protein
VKRRKTARFDGQKQGKSPLSSDKEKEVQDSAELVSMDEAIFIPRKRVKTQTSKDASDGGSSSDDDAIFIPRKRVKTQTAKDASDGGSSSDDEDQGKVTVESY